MSPFGHRMAEAWEPDRFILNVTKTGSCSCPGYEYLYPPMSKMLKICSIQHYMTKIPFFSLSIKNSTEALKRLHLITVSSPIWKKHLLFVKEKMQLLPRLVMV